jgi:transcriptional regulator with XRE-family HTH domain
VKFRACRFLCPDDAGVKFGKFLSELLTGYGISEARLASMVGRTYRAVHGWMDRDDPPRGEALVTLAEVLDIPLGTFRAAAEGRIELPAEYRSRKAWKEIERRAKVWDWFKSAPRSVQQSVLMESIPEGMEQDYLRHVIDYFTQRLTGKGGKKRAGRDG